MPIKPNGSTADFSINYSFSALLEPLHFFFLYISHSNQGITRDTGHNSSAEDTKLEPLQLFGNILYPKAAAGPSGGAVPRTLDGGLLLTAYVQHKQ